VAKASSVNSVEVATMTCLPLLAARFAARTTIGTPLIGSKTFAGNLEEFVRACITAILAKNNTPFVFSEHYPNRSEKDEIAAGLHSA
jgi:hypothetical protein